jgi:hypothetical protein
MLAYIKATGSSHDNNSNMVFLIVVIRQVQLVAKLRMKAIKRNADTEEYYSPLQEIRLLPQ